MPQTMSLWKELEQGRTGEVWLASISLGRKSCSLRALELELIKHSPIEETLSRGKFQDPELPSELFAQSLDMLTPYRN